MKKFYILLLFFGIIGSNYSFADCITGYACSIESLQAKNLYLEKMFIDELNEYFKTEINEDFMLGNIKKDLKYKDFFPFSGILQCYQ